MRPAIVTIVSLYLHWVKSGMNCHHENHNCMKHITQVCN